MAKEKRSFYGTGRRKGSVAKVTLTPGTGKITVMVEMFTNTCHMKY